MLAPVVDEVAAEIGETAIVGKVDTGAHMVLAQKFGVRAVPTLIFIKDGEEKERGNTMTKDAIVQKLQSL